MARKRAPVKRRRAQPPGIYLYVNIGPTRVTVLHVARIERLHAGYLRAPLLTEERAAALAGYDAASEVVVALLARDGRVLNAFGWPTTAHTCVECKERVVHATEDQAEREARWRIPTTAAARYLQFYRVDLTRRAGGKPSLSRTSLGVYDLKRGSGGGRRPRFPVPIGRAKVQSFKWTAARARRRDAPPFPDGGYLKGATTLVRRGDPSRKFNVVITCDGFTEGELDVFDHYAGLVAGMFATIEPYASLAPRMNIYKVTAVSTESGITNCPARGTMRNTFFKTTGCWNGSTSTSFVGTQYKPKIMDAVDTIIPQRYAHCVITIVNCRVYGGSSPPELGMAFLTLGDPRDPESMFVQTAAHECGHVIGHLNEEYNPCNRRDPARQYPNEATEDEVHSGRAPWQHLARPDELDAAGRFVAFHRFGDGMTRDIQPVLTPHAHETMLGAFWGCDSGSPPANPGAITMDNPAGKHYYRAMATCRMRNIESEFCRHCADVLTGSITEVST